MKGKSPIGLSGLTTREARALTSLKSAIGIQDFLDTLAVNFEKDGETIYSPRAVLRKKKAHCLEGALCAAAALWCLGEEPLLLDLKSSVKDDDHVVALYRKNGYWGAISKTNHASLRFRDPIYRTIRELALSYFHEYFDNTSGKKVLTSYSRPFNLKRYDTKWLISEENLQYISDDLDASPHVTLVPKKNRGLIRKADHMERKAGAIVEWTKKNPRT